MLRIVLCWFVIIMGSEQRLKTGGQFISKLSSYFPKFTEIFDEETFYIFAVVFVFATFFIAFLLSRCVKITDLDDGAVTYTRLTERQRRFKVNLH